MRLISRELSQYYDYYNRYEITMKPLSYFDRKITIHTLTKQGLPALVLLLDMRYDIKTCNIGHRQVWKYNTQLMVSYANNINTWPTNINKLVKLKTLCIYNCKLNSISPNIKRLKLLKELSLPNNKLTIIPKEIGKLCNLEKLDLANNRITKLPDEIIHLTKLNTIYLNGNPICAEEQAKIRRLQPNCVIYF